MVSFLLTVVVLLDAARGARPGAGGEGSGGAGAGSGTGGGAAAKDPGSGGASDGGSDPAAAAPGDGGRDHPGDTEAAHAPPTMGAPASARDADGALDLRGGVTIGAAAKPEPAREPPKWGFTLPDDPPTPRVGTGDQIAAVIGQFPNSRTIINLDVTSSMQSSRDAVAAILPQLFTTLEAGTIAVMGFRDIVIGEPNVEILPPTPRTTDSDTVRRMVERVMAVFPAGGGDAPETSYQLVIQNMRSNPWGTPAVPNIQFVITDAPEKQAELLPRLLGMAEKSRTRIFMIYTSTGAPILRELTHWASGAAAKPGTP